MRLIDFFDKGASIDPDRPCFIEDCQSKSYAQVQRSSLVAADRLVTAGVAPGSRVAVLSHNSSVAFEGILAAVRSGSTWVTLNARSTREERVAFLNVCGVDALLHSADFAGEAQAMLSLCPRLSQTIALDALCAPADTNQPALATDVLADLEEPSADKIVMIAGSGGTTGLPKGVMIANRTWEAGMAAAQVFWDDHPVYLVAAPMTHAAGGLVFGLSQMGATNIILKEFDAIKVMRAIQEHKVTHVFLPPTAIYMLIDHPEVRNFDYSSLKFFAYAAAPISVERLEQAIGIFGPVMAQFYSQTECFMCVSFFSPQQHSRAIAVPALRHRLASCGRPSRFVRLGIADDDGHFLPAGERGEIVIQSSLEFVGYADNPDETAYVKRGGWHHSGDIGYLDEAGYLYIVDRKRDMIISGGFNVFPQEIERVIGTHPNVRECAVIGTPDEKWGEAVTAVVVPRDALIWDERDFLLWCREKLSGVNAPKRAHLSEGLPKTATGKILKREIRRPFWEDRDREV